ncbi:hypothetical protein ACS0PU_011473 [Formica fusca]
MDMQDSDVDGPHTTGMHSTSYRLRVLRRPWLTPPPPTTPSLFSFKRHALLLLLLLLLSSFSFLHVDLSISLSLSLSLSPLFLAFLPLTSYHFGYVNGFGRPLGLLSANLFGGNRVFDRILDPLNQSINRSRETNFRDAKR